MTAFEPVYVNTFKKGILEKKAEEASALLGDCTLCPRGCGVDRLSGETGVCRTGLGAVVSSFHPHFGEEAPLVGENGSGTIFFSCCNLGCIFCQNYEISHGCEGQEVAPNQLAFMMLSLQNKGCRNINLVTPSHVVPQILQALLIAVRSGLSIPLVYNSSGYDGTQALSLMDGVVDIYMPDFKFWDKNAAKALTGAGDYPETARRAVAEMHRQVGDLVTDENGNALRGLIVRHLVMPGGLAGTGEIMNFIAQIIGPNTYVNIMGQYHPCASAHEHPGIDRRPTPEEFARALKQARDAGIKRFDKPGFQG